MAHAETFQAHQKMKETRGSEARAATTKLFSFVDGQSEIRREKPTELFDLKPLVLQGFTSFFQERRFTHNYNTHSSTRQNDSLTAYKTRRGQRSIKYYGPKIWNDIPTSSRNLSKYQFKKFYKDLTLSNY